MSDKQITGWLVIDWKNETHRTRKSKPKATDLGANEVLAELNVEIHIPEVEVPTLDVAVDVPEPQVYGAELEALEPEEMPDWSEAADELLEGRVDQIRTAEPGEATLEHVNVITTETLVAVDSRPPAEQVRDYVADRIHEIQTDTGHSTEGSDDE